MDSMIVPAWEHEMLRQIVDSDYAQIDLLVLNGMEQEEAVAPRSRLWSKWDGLFYRLYCRLENRRWVGEADAFTPCDSRGLLANVPILAVTPLRRRGSDAFGGEDLRRIWDRDLDVLIRLGFGNLRGPILRAARCGVWSLQHGDTQAHHGGLPGFWEVFQHKAVFESTLQVFNGKLDGAKTLFRSHTGTDATSVRRTCNSSYWKTLSAIPRKLKELHDLGEEEQSQQAEEQNGRPRPCRRQIQRIPSNVEFMKLSAGMVGRYVRQKARDAFCREQWALMFDLQDGISHALDRFKRIIPPRDRFWADPHIIHRGGKYHVFLEELPFSTGKGHISLLTMDEQGRRGPVTPILQEPFHMSYPFVFEWQGRFFMVPETRANNTISLYECVDFPHKWEFRHHLMESVSALDSTLFCDGDRWWLFATIAAHRGAPTSDELFLFWSDSPLSRRWRAHPRNPVLSDARRARPAGKLFRHNGHLCRPSQDCSRSYGSAVNINHVTTLSETQYHEETVRVIAPDPRHRKIDGLHTFQHVDRLTMVDVRFIRSRFA